MRLDVFLKRAGLIKQRSLAKEICDNGLVKMDGRIAKAGKGIGWQYYCVVDLERAFAVAGLQSRNVVLSW